MFLRCILVVGLACGSIAGVSAQEKLKFEPKFELNKAFYQKVSTKVDQIVKVQGGADLNLKHEQTFLFKWLPTKLDADRWTVKLAIEGAILKVDIASNPVNYDSTAEQPAAGNNPGLADFFKNLIGTELTITYAKGMVVEKVEGREDFLKKLGTTNPQMEALLKKLLTDESLKEMADPTAGLMPGADKAAGVASGETWEKKTSMPLGPIGTYDRTLSFKYVGKDTEKKELDKVEVTAKPSKELTFNLTMAYTDASFDSFFNDVNGDGIPDDVSTLTLRRAPTFQWSATMDYSRPLGSGTLDFSTTLRYQSAYQTCIPVNRPVVLGAVRNDDRCLTEDREDLAAQLAYTIKVAGDHELRFTAFARNITNNRGLAATLPVAGLFTFGTAKPPRTFGGEIAFKF